MTAKAGHLFRCSCCGEQHPEEQARMDEQLGPICETCLRLTRWATAYLKKAGISRPLTTNDINESNKPRFNL